MGGWVGGSTKETGADNTYLASGQIHDIVHPVSAGVALRLGNAGKLPVGAPPPEGHLVVGDDGRTAYPSAPLRPQASEGDPGPDVDLAQLVVELLGGFPHAAGEGKEGGKAGGGQWRVQGREGDGPLSPLRVPCASRGGGKEEGAGAAGQGQETEEGEDDDEAEAAA